MPPEHAQHLHCLHCGYDLTGLTEHRCPECGRGFDENALRRAATRFPLTFGEAILQLIWIPFVVGAAGVVGLPIVVCLYALANRYQTMGELIALSALSIFVLASLRRTHGVARQMVTIQRAGHEAAFGGGRVVFFTVVLIVCMIVLSIALLSIGIVALMGLLVLLAIL